MQNYKELVSVTRDALQRHYYSKNEIPEDEAIYKWIDKTKHKPLLPSIKNKGNAVVKMKIPSILLVLLCFRLLFLFFVL